MSDRANHKPTICQVLHSLSVGGAELLARDYALTMRDEFRFVFACLDEAGELANALERAGFVVHSLQRRPGFDWRCAGRLRRFVRQQRVQLLHAHQYAPFAYAAISRRLSRRPPILFHEHGRHFPDLPRRKRMLINRLLFAPGDRAVAVGRHVRQALIENEGLPAARVEVIYNGVDCRQPDRPAEVRARVRRELNLSDDTFAVIQVGRLNRLKDHATALRAMARLAPHGQAAEGRTNWRLLLAGDGELREPLQRQAAELGIGDAVQFLGTRDDVRELLAAADCFLMSSVSEGIPLALIEAMAAPLPVVATEAGGIPEVVESGESGLLVAAGDDRAIAERLRQVRADRGAAERLAAAGRARAEQVFSADRMHEAFRRVYRQMLGLEHGADLRPTNSASSRPQPVRETL